MSDRIKKLLVATNNRGKLVELRGLLDGLPVALQNLCDFESIIEIEETGTTFAENARLKASGYAVQTGLAAIADDSGLFVPILDSGGPGVRSRRYASEDAKIRIGH